MFRKLPSADALNLFVTDADFAVLIELRVRAVHYPDKVTQDGVRKVVRVRRPVARPVTVEPDLVA